MNLREYLQWIQEQYDKYREYSIELNKKGLLKHEQWYLARMLSFKETLDEAERCGLLAKLKENDHEQKGSK
jgi:hypothetical protein